MLKIWCSFVFLLAAAGRLPGQTDAPAPRDARVLSFNTARTPVPGDRCATPAVETSFSSADAEVWVVAVFDTVQRGETIRVDFLSPAGVAYRPLEEIFENFADRQCWVHSLPVAGAVGAGAPGSWTARIFFNNNPAATRTFEISVPPASPLRFTSPGVLPAATAGAAYFYTLQAAGGAQPYRYSLDRGTLPAGVTLSTAGVLRGTPLQVGGHNLTISAVDAQGARLTRTFALGVSPAPTRPRITSRVVTKTFTDEFCDPPPAVTNFLNTDAEAWLYFSFADSLAGDRMLVEWLDPNGDVALISTGTRSTGGSDCLRAGLRISGGVAASRPGDWRARLRWNEIEVFSIPFRITALPGVLAITSSALPAAAVGRPYSYTFQATGGVPPYRWSISSGTLPAGLTLSAAGVLEGTPTSGGVSSFTVRLEDSQRVVATRSLSLTVEAARSLQLSATQASFAWTRGAAAPQPRRISVTSAGGALAFAASARTDRGAWLSVSPLNATTPANLDIAVNPQNLDAGTYRGSVLVSAAGAVPPTVAIDVTLTVTAPTPPPVVTRSRDLIYTFAGNDWVFPPAGSATDAPLGGIYFLGADPQGNVLVADPDNNMVIRVRPDGGYVVAAGNGISGYSGDGGFAENASLAFPLAAAADAAGNIYIADRDNHRVRRVSADGIITTYAGTGVSGFSGDGGPAVEARLRFPSNLTVDLQGNLYIVDGSNSRIRRVSPDGAISTYAGIGQNGYSGDNGPAIEARIYPEALAADAAGNLYLAEFRNFRVRRVSPDGIITTVAGNGEEGFSGDGGPATEARFDNPGGVAVDAAGNLYIADTNNYRIRVVSPDGVIRTYAGDGGGNYGEGLPGDQASFLGPFGIALDPSGNLFVADRPRFRVRRIDPQRIVTTVAGNGGYRNSADGSAAGLSYFYVPHGIAFDGAGNLLIVDSYNQRVRRIDRDGAFRTIAGSGGFGSSSSQGRALDAFFSYPYGIAVDAAGNVYVSDTGNESVRVITPDGTIRDFAGNRQSGFSGDGGPAAEARLNTPTGLAVDAAGNLYIADTDNHRVRRVDRGTGRISTVAGNGTRGSNGDGGQAAQASLNLPYGLAFDRAGNLLVAESGGHVVRRITPAGVISTVAGNGTDESAGDGGPARQASLDGPRAVAVDAAGNLYISEFFGSRVRRVDTNGIIATVAGTGAPTYAGDGGLASQAALRFPNGGLAFDGAGNLYIADTNNHRIRIVTAEQPRIELAPRTLSFNARSNGDPTAPLSVSLTSSSFGLPYTTAVATQSGGQWLRVTPSTGVIPGAIAVSADPSGLAAGSYTGTLTITAPNATPPALTVTVSLTVTGGQPPRLGFEPDAVRFTLPEQEGAAEEVVFVTNRGGGALQFRAQSGGAAWLSAAALSPVATPSANGAARISARASGLAPGTYESNVMLVSDTTGERLTVPVTLTVTAAARPRILLSQTGMSFRVASGSSEFPKCFAVLNVGQGSLDFSVSTTASWLTARRDRCPYRAVSSLTAVPEVVVDVNPAGLAARDQEYEAEVRVTASSADNSPQSVRVGLRVLPAGTPVGPEMVPSGLVFTGAAGGPNPGSLDVSLLNFTASAIRFSTGAVFLEGGNFFAHQPAQGELPPTLQTRVNPPLLRVQPEAGRLAQGIYTGYITLGTQQYGARNVQVLLALSATGSFDPAGGRAATAACTPSSLSIVHTLLGDEFLAQLRQPLPVEVVITDDCGRPVTQGSAIATFSNGDAPLRLVPLGDGRFTGTWTPTRNVPGRVTIQVKAQLTQVNASGQQFKSGTLR